MSTLVELNGKAGRLCQAAESGQTTCPCIVRKTSEDVLTGEVFGHLRHLRPHLWLNPMLNQGLGTNRFRQVFFKDFKLRMWQRQAKYPPELLPWVEGCTEPDVILEWENPPTSVWIEAKYKSGLAAGTTHARRNDQVVRGVRTMLAATGHIQGLRLFNTPKRDAAWLALLPHARDPMVDHYRESRLLMQAIPNRRRVRSLPPEPFVGTATWGMITQVLHSARGGMTWAERSVAASLTEYLAFKFSGDDKTFPKPAFAVLL